MRERTRITQRRKFGLLARLSERLAYFYAIAHDIKCTAVRERERETEKRHFKQRRIAIWKVTQSGNTILEVRRGMRSQSYARNSGNNLNLIRITVLSEIRAISSTIAG